MESAEKQEEYSREKYREAEESLKDKQDGLIRHPRHYRSFESSIAAAQMEIDRLINLSHTEANALNEELGILKQRIGEDLKRLEEDSVAFQNLKDKLGIKGPKPEWEL